MKRSRLPYLFILSLYLLMSCQHDSIKYAQSYEVNEFIQEVLTDIYLWSDQLSDISPSSEKDPITYFNRLLYNRDKWSYLTDNANLLIENLEGIDETYGFELGYIKDESSVNYYGVILFVYDNSPAARSGLKRGDVILKINDNYIKDKNEFGNNKGLITLTMGRYKDDRYYQQSNISLSSQKMQTSPIIESKIITIENHRIGYLMYSSFIGSFNKELEKIFNDFKNEGITDLVLDLRYNGGGDENASNYICSVIAPKSVTQSNELLSVSHWNENYHSMFSNDLRLQDNIQDYFQDLNCNLDLPTNRVYILTSENTASASEYVAVCLKPYMQVTLIGTRTEGKFTSMVLVKPEDRGIKNMDNWLMLPVVCRFTNIYNYPSEYLYGLTADFKAVDDPLSGHELGDIDEPLLYMAIDVITGEHPNTYSPDRDNNKNNPKVSIYSKNEMTKNFFILK